MGSQKKIKCNNCGFEWNTWNNPIPTVDALIEIWDDNKFKGIVLIERKNFPFGWAIPGGFMDYGELAETTAIREAKEETGLDVEIKYLLGFYSDPARDPRQHTVTAVYVCQSTGNPVAGDDAKNAKIFKLEEIENMQLAFDHSKVIRDYKNKLKNI